MNYWLMKSEPAMFSVAHLNARPKRTEHWDGVRNYQARNFMRAMQRGDQAFFYHSSCDEPGVTGMVEIVREAYPDFTAFDPANAHYDPKSTTTKPIWYMVDVKLVHAFKQPVSLAKIKTVPTLEHMRLVQRGSRLSIMPMTKKEWDTILKLATPKAKQENTRS